MQLLPVPWTHLQSIYPCKTNFSSLGSVIICSSCCEDFVVVEEEEEDMGQQNDIRRMTVNVFMQEIMCMHT